MSTASQQTAGRPPRRFEADRSRHGEQGFSLIELLVVCLVIGALCGIAIPQFLSQSTKAKDAAAKELVHSAQLAAETIATENDGSYESVTTTELNRADPSIAIEESASHAYVAAATADKAGYSLTVRATSGDQLTLTKDSSGAISRSCTSADNGCSEGSTGSW